MRRGLAPVGIESESKHIGDGYRIRMCGWAGISASGRDGNKIRIEAHRQPKGQATEGEKEAWNAMLEKPQLTVGIGSGILNLAPVGCKVLQYSW